MVWIELAATALDHQDATVAHDEASDAYVRKQRVVGSCGCGSLREWWETQTVASLADGFGMMSPSIQEE
jgi:hypothetical protein